MWCLAVLVACYAAAADSDYLTAREITRAMANWPAYERAGLEADVPAAAIAAVHYKESGFREGFWSTRKHRAIRNRGGPFMMDQGGQGTPEFGRRIRLEEERVAMQYGRPASSRVDRDLEFAALCAADELRRKSPGPLYRWGGMVDEWNLAIALWGYNGRAAWHQDAQGRKTWRASAYVNNHPRGGRRLKSRLRLPDGTVTEWLDENPGALVIYRELRRRIP